MLNFIISKSKVLISNTALLKYGSGCGYDDESEVVEKIELFISLKNCRFDLFLDKGKGRRVKYFDIETKRIDEYDFVKRMEYFRVIL